MSEKPDELAVVETPAAAPVSLRDALEAGFAADAAKSTEIKPATIPDAAQTEAKAAPNRDEAGKFAPKAADAEPVKPPAPDATEPKITVPPEAAATEAPKEPIPPPAAWTAAAKSKWSTLDPEVQAEIAKRENDMVQGTQKQALQIKRFERMDEVIAPHRNYLAMNGLDEATYVRSLVAADEQLRGPNPLGALAQIAGMYNIDLRQIGQPGQQPPQEAQPDPRYQALEQRLAELQQTVVQQQSTAQQTEQTQTQAQIDAFAKDHLYFENVRPEMAAFLRAGTATDMEKAYEMACWARPDIRPLLMKEQADKQAAEQRAADSAKANEARQASVSITGSPTPGASPVATGPSPSIRESLERQFDAALS